MKSIQLSLIVYFLLLLAVALGAVSYLSYESTRQALTEKETSDTKLREAQYRVDRDRVHLDFDKHLLSRARQLAGRAFLVTHQLDVPVVVSMIFANLPATAHLQLSVWDFAGRLDGSKKPAPQQGWRLRVARPYDVRLFAHDEDHPEDMPDVDSLVEPGEYYQLFTTRGRMLDRSPTLGDGTFPFDDELRAKIGPHPQQRFFDNVELRPGHTVRRVTILDTPRRVRTGLIMPLVRPKKTQPPPGFGRPTGLWFFLSFASETTSRDKQLAELEQTFQRDRDEMSETSRLALAGLRTRMLWIGLGTFTAILVGGFWLVYLGLHPLNRLTDAVRRVSEKDFRLPIDPARLPRELQPIAGRMAEMLEQLRRAFAREKQAAADISHELRTPLATLLTTIDVALHKPRSPEQYREVLEECRSSGQHMNQLVERLLKLARLDAGGDYLRPRQVDVTELARQCADMVRPLARARGLDLRVHTNGPAMLHADPDKLREVVNNLLHNAIEYNKPNGAIDLTVARDNGRLVVEVRDTGIGIPPEARDRIFERFFRADPSRHAEGMHAGLGLAIVKGYVDLMGGTIGVDSGPDGSTFRVDLPAPDARFRDASLIG